MTRGWLIGWSAFVGISWFVLAAAFVSDETCSFICFTFGDMLMLLALPAAFVWALGMIVRFIVGRLRGPRASRGAGATTDVD
jgi:flagellar biogenesis protein FliO